MHAVIKELYGNLADVYFVHDGKTVGRAKCKIDLDQTIRLESFSQYGEHVHTTIGNMAHYDKVNS